MTEKEKKGSKGTDWLGLISFGFFLILVGTILTVTPNFTEEVISFFKDFHLANVTSKIVFPAPESNHPVVYTAAMQFCLVFGAFQIVILTLRFVFHESSKRKIETLSGIVFWFTVGFFLYLLTNEVIGWFGFIAGVIISIGLTIIVSNIFKLLR
jgi:hypothetical protein